MSAISSKAPAQSRSTSQSQWAVVWRQFLKHPLARVGLLILGVLYLLAIFAGFIAPYGGNQYTTDAATRVSWAPPTPIHIRNAQGQLTRPFIYGVKREVDFTTFRDKYVEDKSQVYPIHFFVRRPSARYNLFGLIPTDLKLFGVDEPARLFLWGSDNLGRDQFSRIMYGGQISLSIGLIATVVSLVIGLILGGIAGYFRGWADTLIMRTVEVLVSIPDLFLLLTLRALLPIDINPIFSFYLITVILAAIGWGGIARVVRSQLLSTRELDYVQAATALGASDARIIGQHMLPATASYIIVIATLLIPGYILLESGLSFLGVGVVEPYASWGKLLQQAYEGGFESISGRPWVLIPGLFITLAVLAWQFVGDGLRDAFDPRRRR
ncbi:MULTISPECIES: ABC transporter permease [Deinococcus]|uniref:ABC-type oligopeptide transport system, permease component n=1 Tax=Deinococcus geothermalis (strain DSM 11300 / CIP 105573 / AG-3a) TaxID=319795 RepID=Q1IYP7_DEIGD|nr:ABC-type oligopeptide transport system, permease component [Deinococcus geothermalis DSM 11300]